MFIIILLIVVGSTIWVGIDAKKHQVSTLAKAPYSLNTGAVAWVLYCILFWIAAFPCYLYRRSKVLSAAAATAGNTATPAGNKGPGKLKLVGTVLMALGLLSLVYFLMIYDTSVEVPTETVMGQQIGGGRVHNTGLLQNRQIGIIIGGVIALAGLSCFLVGTSSGSRASAAPLESQTDTERQLRLLAKLRDDGVINLDDFERKKAELLNTLVGNQ